MGERGMVPLRTWLASSGIALSLICVGISPATAFDVEQRPFYVTQDGKGKPVMDLFA